MAKSGSRSAVERWREHWRRLLEPWRASGLSQAALCRRHGIQPIARRSLGALKARQEPGASVGSARFPSCTARSCVLS